MWCHLLLLMPLLGLVLFLVLPVPVALPTYMIVVVFSLLLYVAVYRALKLPVKTGQEGMVGATAVAVEPLDPEGTIRYGGELWRASSRQPIAPGEQVRIVGFEGMRVIVEPEGVGNRRSQGNACHV